MDQFTKERDNLEKIRQLKRNEHMTLNLGSFSQEGRYYLIFPWAEGGDLDNLWKDGNSRLRTPELALWSLRQMCGLAETLEALHLGFDEKTNCRHGDLKPQNILHFLTNGEGILKITDFGISSIHENTTFERKETPTETRATTPSYQAPEAAPALLEKQARSRKYDIWSLGCIFLEFTIWLVGSWEDVESFNEERKPEPTTDATLSHFYDITNGIARVHPVVSRRITQLKMTSRIKQGTALGDILELIEKRLLKVEVEERFDAGKLYQSLRNIVHKAESGPIYPFNNTSSVALA
jgi:serine/threonine protein kinase